MDYGGRADFVHGFRTDMFLYVNVLCFVIVLVVVVVFCCCNFLMDMFEVV